MIPAAETPVTDLSLDIQTIAERQAELDLALLAQLRERAKAGEGFLKDGEEMTEEDFDALATEAEATVPYRPMNRAERRQAVEQFKMNLRSMPRAQPTVNPTIRPRKHR